MTAGSAPQAAPGVFRHGRSTLELRHGVRYLRLAEDDAYRTGFAYGRLLVQCGEPLLRVLGNPLVRAVLALLDRACSRHLQRLRVPEDYREELRGCADATGLRVEHLFFLNFCFDVLKKYGFHCSTFAVFTADSTLVGRNTDLLPLLARLLLAVCRPIVVDVAIPGRMRFSHVSVPLFVGAMNGFNEAGVAVNSHQILHAAENPLGRRLASSLLMRLVLERAASLDDARRIVAENLSMRSLNIVVTCRGSRSGAVFEVHPDGCHVVPHAGSFACTTHFESDAMRPLHDGPVTPSQVRLASMRAMLDEIPRPDRQTLMRWLRDCRNGPAHRLSGRSVSNRGTCQSFVFDLDRRCLWVSNGRTVPVSSSGEYVRVRVDADGAGPFDADPDMARHGGGRDAGAGIRPIGPAVPARFAPGATRP